MRAADAIFATGKAGDHELLGDRRRRGDRRTLFVVYDLGLPELFAGFCVERDQAPIERAEQDLSIGVGDAPAIEVAADERLDILSDHGLILPADFPVRASSA